jgi:hypothetical protein
LHLQNKVGKKLGLLSVALSLVLFVSACDNNQPATVDDPAVVGGDTDVVVATEEAVDVVATTEPVGEEAGDAAIDVDEADAVSTTVMTDTVVDTDVITEIEVMTETTAADIIVEQQVITDTDVTIDRDSETETDVTVETEDVDSASTSAIVLLTDAAGTAFLGDPVEQRPLFASQDNTMITDPNFEAIQVDDEALYGEGVDQGLLGELDQDGMRLLTYNGHPLYRYTGPEDGDWRTAASDAGLSPLTATGEMGEMSE